MTASFLKQNPNTQNIKKNAIGYDKTQLANFQGKAFFQAIKR